VLALGHKSGDLPGMVESGELSMCYISSLRYAKWVPELALFDLPFLFPDRPAAYKVLDGKLGQSLRAKTAAQSPFQLLAYWDNGFRHFSNKLRPIRKPTDCKGLRIRIQMSEVQAASLRLLGIEPILEDIKIFVEQIGGDRFDGQDNPLTNIVNFNIHKHHRHITMSGHVYGVACLMCNREQYESWPDDVRRAVCQAAAEATTLQRQLAAAEDEEMLKRLDPSQNEVVKLTAEEHRAFAVAVSPVTDKYRKDFGASFFAMLD
jgi:TRAP-type C4-dicarboxylate transport system substrate-binding protein